jgi:hypothetical protein
MEELHGRALIESRYGKISPGATAVLDINGAEYDIETLLAHVDLLLEDTKPLDMGTCEGGHFFVRYYDGADQCVVAYEFDADFRFVVEYRGHIAEWIGEDAYYDSLKSVPFRCPITPEEM